MDLGLLLEGFNEANCHGKLANMTNLLLLIMLQFHPIGILRLVDFILKCSH